MEPSPSPLDQLLNYAKILIPVGLSAPALFPHFLRDDRSRSPMVVLWYLPPSVLAAIAFQCLWINLPSLSSGQPPPLPWVLLLFVVLTTVAVWRPYFAIGSGLVEYLERQLHKESLQEERQAKWDEARDLLVLQLNGRASAPPSRIATPDSTQPSPCQHGDEDYSGKAGAG